MRPVFSSSGAKNTTRRAEVWRGDDPSGDNTGLSSGSRSSNMSSIASTASDSRNCWPRVSSERALADSYPGELRTSNRRACRSLDRRSIPTVLAISFTSSEIPLSKRSSPAPRNCEC